MEMFHWMSGRTIQDFSCLIYLVSSGSFTCSYVWCVFICLGISLCWE